MYWPEIGLIERNINAKILEGVKMTEHDTSEAHGEQHPDTPVKERKKKKKMPSGLGFSMGPGMSINVAEDKK